MNETEDTMPAAEVDIQVETEQDRVERWRAEELERNGYDQMSALELASRTDVDLHRAIELVRAGCPTETALRILL
jgi:hypothetical protein